MDSRTSLASVCLLISLISSTTSLYLGAEIPFFKSRWSPPKHTGQHSRLTLYPPHAAPPSSSQFETPNTSTCCSAPRRPQRTLPPTAPLFSILPVISVGPFPPSNAAPPQTRASLVPSKRQIPAVNDPILPITAITPPRPAIRKGKQVKPSSHNLPPDRNTQHVAQQHFLKLALRNTRSLSTKAAILDDFRMDNKLDVCLTETWITSLSSKPN